MKKLKLSLKFLLLGLLAGFIFSCDLEDLSEVEYTTKIIVGKVVDAETGAPLENIRLKVGDETGCKWDKYAHTVVCDGFDLYANELSGEDGSFRLWVHSPYRDLLFQVGQSLYACIKSGQIITVPTYVGFYCEQMGADSMPTGIYLPLNDVPDTLWMDISVVRGPGCY